MSKRAPGFYWVDWTDDVVVSGRRPPGPLVGHWDGTGWWFSHMEAYRFDCEVKVLSECLMPPIRHMAEIETRVA